MAKREYFYEINVRAAVDSWAIGWTACIMRMFMLKKFVIWPFAPLFAVSYIYRSKQLFAFHSKKLFDMCNVGEQYEVGFARNVVLRHCNQLTDREDF